MKKDSGLYKYIRNVYNFVLRDVEFWQSAIWVGSLDKYAGERGAIPIKIQSKKVNEDISQIVFGIPPFPFVKESLERLKDHADMMVVSQTPGEALKREWEEHDIDRYTKIIAGQEFGTKSEHLKFAAKGKYPDTHILMIGDAPGDLKAARCNGVLFFPINPGSEEISWERFYKFGINRFLTQKYIGDYQDKLIADFEKLLPEKPHWA